MINRLSSYLKFGNTYCGIEHTTKNEVESIFISELKKEKNELHVANTLNVNSINDIPNKHLKNKAASLVINNSNVLFKTIKSEKNDSLQLINTAFPNISISDFYFDILHQENEHFIWICRKIYVDNLIKIYAKKKVFITSLFIGNSAICNSSEFITNNSISTSNALITKKNNLTASINKQLTIQLTTYNINGLFINSDYLLSFSSALENVLNTNHLISNYNIIQAREDFKNVRFFKLFSKFGLLFIFLILIINFLFFNYYFNTVNRLNIVSQNNDENKASLLKLNKNIEKKQKLVDDLLKMKSSLSSFYINSIVTQIPTTILLKEFIFQPLKTKPKANKQITTFNNQLILTGSSTNHTNFSTWVAAIEGIAWVNNVIIVNYGASTNTTSNFTIKVFLKDDD